LGTQESPAGPKRIKIPPNNQSEFYPKEQKAPLLYQLIPDFPCHVATAAPFAALYSPPRAAARSQRRRQQPQQDNAMQWGTLPLPRTSQPAKELLQLWN